MRVNVYSQELITNSEEYIGALTELETKESNTGIKYSVVRIFLQSYPGLHHLPEDDDRSAIAFWLPQSPERREFLARSFEDLARFTRHAPAETGLD